MSSPARILNDILYVGPAFASAAVGGDVDVFFAMDGCDQK